MKCEQPHGDRDDGVKENEDDREPQGRLFPIDDMGLYRTQQEPQIKRPQHPIWTENKARLIERYLYYFVLITKHGTYIDGFAGPQKADKPTTWAAKLVLDSEPRWLRHFFLFDLKSRQAERLRELKSQQPTADKNGRRVYREIHVREGDFNALVHDLLKSGQVSQSEATFCLLDQRSFQCHWATAKALSEYKAHQEHKIELFYFLATGWMRRALSAIKNSTILQRWWGRDDWGALLHAQPSAIRDLLITRFKEELGYKSVKAWPIYERQNGGAIMYHMIHCTDHPHAPALMSRAYDRAVQPKEPLEQLHLEFPGLAA
jgi:three-Cys-motif partner protein